MTEKSTSVLYDWVRHVQTLIKRHQIVEPIIGERTGEISKGWIYELILLISSQHKRDEQGDGCLWHAYAVGSVLLSWYFRTAFAKTCDPRRPEDDRIKALVILARNTKALLDMFDYEITDEDRKIYTQEWQPIFDDKEEKAA